MNLNSLYRGPNSVDPPRLSQTSQPSAEPLTLAEAKLWLRIDSAVIAEDALITDLITGARAHFEAITGICCVSQSWLLSLSQVPVRYGEYGLEYGLAPGMTRYTGAPNGREIVIPRAPLLTIESFKYLDSDGALQTFSSANYTIGAVGARNAFGRLWLKDGIDWPDIGQYPNAIQIAFTAGLGTDPTAAAYPKDVKMPIRWLLAHFYENRLPVGTGDTLNELPFSLRSLIENYRVAFIA